MISVILVEPENPGNIGAIARAMANFGFKDLILINPQCNHLADEARNRAKWANKILENAKVTKDFNKTLKKFHTTIATTAILGTDYNIPRSPVSPEQLTDIIKPKTNIALIFGRESAGLTNEEINITDFIITIPTSTKYPTMNLATSVAIVLYELSKKSKTKKTNEHILLASKTEKDQVMKNMTDIINKTEFSTSSKKQTQKTIWKRIFSKSFLTKREAFAILGLLKKLK